MTFEIVHNLTPEMFEDWVGEKISPYLKNQINNYKMKFSYISEQENNQTILRILKTLRDPNLKVSGAHRINDWEKGWGENLTQWQETGDYTELRPKYFGQSEVTRLNGRFVKGKSENFQQMANSTVLDWIFDKYCRDAKNIHEFGCGTGWNLLLLRQVNKEANIWGLDWVDSSQRLVEGLSRHFKDPKLFGAKFNFFEPDYEFNFPSDSIAMTYTALEQVGDKFHKFIDYLIAKRPKLCIHKEPIIESLDENQLLDHLAGEYYRRRGYLTGLLPHLKSLEAQKKIVIHKVVRVPFGALYVDGFSLIVWSPSS